MGRVYRSVRKVMRRVEAVELAPENSPLDWTAFWLGALITAVAMAVMVGFTWYSDRAGFAGQQTAGVDFILAYGTSQVGWILLRRARPELSRGAIAVGAVVTSVAVLGFLGAFMGVFTFAPQVPL